MPILPCQISIAGILDHVIEVVYSIIVPKIGLSCFILFNSPNSFLVSLAPDFFWNIICNRRKIVHTTNIRCTRWLKGNQSLSESLWFVDSRTLFDCNDWIAFALPQPLGTFSWCKYSFRPCEKRSRRFVIVQPYPFCPNNFMTSSPEKWLSATMCGGLG